MYSTGIVTLSSTRKIKSQIVEVHRAKYGCCYGAQRTGMRSGRPDSHFSKTQIRKRKEGGSTYKPNKHVIPKE